MRLLNDHLVIGLDHHNASTGQRLKAGMHDEEEWFHRHRLAVEVERHLLHALDDSNGVWRDAGLGQD